MNRKNTKKVNSMQLPLGALTQEQVMAGFGD